MTIANAIVAMRTDFQSRLALNLPSGILSVNQVWFADSTDSPSGSLDKSDMFLIASTVMNDTVNVTQSPEGYSRIPGIHTVQIYAPSGGNGTYRRSQRQVMADIFDLFRAKSFGVVRCQAVSFDVIGETESGYRVDCNIDFYIEGY